MKKIVWAVFASVTYGLLFLVPPGASRAHAGDGHEYAMIDPSQVSVQLYSVRSLVPDSKFGDAAYITELLRKIKEIGYRNVEPYSFWGLTAEQWKTITESLGLTVSSFHQSVTDDDAAIDSLAKSLKILGLDNSIINYGGYETFAEWTGFIDRAARYKDKLAAKGIKANFHTHHHEFIQARNADGTLDPYHVVLDDLLDRLDANLELDVHWAARAGRNPVDLINQYADRITLLHLKDLSFGDGLEFVFEELGQGTLDLENIVAAGNAVGVEYYVVEQDDNYLLDQDGDPDPLASLAASYAYLRDTFFPVR